MSSSSDDAGPTGGSSADVVRLAARIHKRLATAPHLPIPVAEHRRACEKMRKLRDALLDAGEPHARHRLPPAPKEVLLALTCAGVAVTRRLALGHEGDASDALRRTAGLLLALLVLAAGDTTVPAELRGTPDADSYDADGESRAEQMSGHASTVSEYERGALAQTLERASRVASGGFSCAPTPNPPPSVICDSVIWLLNHYAINTGMDELDGWAPLFFRCSAAAAARGLLDSIGQGSFVSMASASVVNDAQRRGERLLAVVSAAESEAGQTCLRDLQLSFLLPRAVVGVRRAVLLPREVNALVTKSHTAVLNAAHESALRGAEWEWRHSEDQLVRACALLAGLATLLNTDDIRKGDAFAGCVCLPFLETIPPEGDGVRLALLEDTDEWVAFRPARPEILARRPGFEGLADCVLILTSLLRR